MQELTSIEETIGYRFTDKKLLELALTHSSFAHEHKLKKNEYNERLEFLGDAVLELVTSDFLYRHHQNDPEGDLTKLRASIVCEPSLADVAGQIRLGDYLRMGKGEESTGGRKRPSLTSDALEALIGGIYLDGGLDAAAAFIRQFILNDIETKKLFYDSKTVLQEIVQNEMNESVTYETVSEEGPDHDKCYVMQVMIAGRAYGKGKGHSKKSAQQTAAYETILMLRKGK